MTPVIRPLDESLVDALASFLVALDGDGQTFLGDVVDSRETAVAAARRWARQDGSCTLVAVTEAGVVHGMVGVEAGHAWSAHVGRLRLVVAPGARGNGLGRRLALAGLDDAIGMSLAKVVVEVRSDQVAVVGLFTALGFQPEALLTDQIRTPQGEVYDMITLAHRVDDVQALFAAVGSPRTES